MKFTPLVTEGATFIFRSTGPVALLNGAPELERGRLPVCALKRRCVPVGANPTRQPLQPEATGAVMEETNWLKPSVSVSRIGDSTRVQAVTRVNAGQASKRTMRRPTRQPFPMSVQDQSRSPRGSPVTPSVPPMNSHSREPSACLKGAKCRREQMQQAVVYSYSITRLAEAGVQAEKPHRAWRWGMPIGTRRIGRALFGAGHGYCNWKRSFKKALTSS